MSAKPKHRKDEDWIYDPEVVEGVLSAKNEADKLIKSGKHLKTTEELIEQFQKEDAKKIQD